MFTISNRSDRQRIAHCSGRGRSQGARPCGKAAGGLSQLKKAFQLYMRIKKALAPILNSQRETG